MAFKNLTDPYTRFESGLYDWLIAPRITAAMEAILNEGDFSFLLDAKEPLKVLDVGCGGGQNSLFLKNRNPILQITALDLSADQIRRARARDPEGTVKFLVGDALQLPFPDKSFDAVFSLGAIKHWPDMKKGLRECLRVLRPEGRLLILDSLRDVTESEIGRFVELLRLPFYARLMFRLFFRKKVVVQSPTRALLEAILKDIPPPAPCLRRLESFPGFLILR
jgi:ubiquinone/menaquinone biosynthesis C-methylase UbiE